MKSVMTHQFSQAPVALIPRSKFDRSCGYKTCFDSGYLIPFFFDEVLPGDTFDVNATIFARLSTPCVPIMDNIFIDTHFFFVPNRLVWEHWANFCGEQDNPDDSTDYVTPYVSVPSSGYEIGSIFDYFGLPVEKSGYQSNGRNNLSPVAFYFRAYNLIWNEWYRDENLQDRVTVNKGDGEDDYSLYTLLKRGKRHDYFTSCLPFPQKNGGVEVSLGGTAPVYGYEDDVMKLREQSHNGRLGDELDPIDPTDPEGTTTSSDKYVSLYSISSKANQAQAYLYTSDSDSMSSGSYNLLSKYRANQYDLNSGLYADLSDVSAITINSLRQAVALQQYYETDARGGTRYTEKIRAHFGVISPDGRLQRPEYLGGSTNRMNINPVAQTSSTDETSPQGNLAGYGVASSTNNGFVKSFTEHGVIIGLVSVRCDLTYQQGLDRMYSRKSITDYYWPAFAHIGEQSVLNKEIYAAGTTADDEVFGYQERYAEYRYKQSLITGKFRSQCSESLDVWHLSQYFENRPELNSEFIEENPPLERVLAVQDEPQILFDSYIRNYCIRPMPLYGIPGLKKL
ncbi:MAG: hypothetical protein LUH11_02410 [Candidatus Gastranaerophilales bacterium]|nr:hypothetical protein [Candidatus Gastranaerophilales bacterium]